MARVPLTAAIRREVLIEASYRCAVPRCLSALAIDVHHIDEDASNNDPSNLIALCPTCHGAFHRKIYSVDAIKFWKLMLQQLNAAYDRNTINLLMMLFKLEQEINWDNFEVTGDGFVAFSALMASGLVSVTIFHRAAFDRPVPYYRVQLSQRGRETMIAWKDGNPDELPEGGVG